MKHNIFEELQERKQKLIALATRAAEYGWIPKKKNEVDNKETISLEEIKDKLDKDT